MAASSDNQIEKVAKSLNIQLKPEQFEILQCLVDRRDCMAVLPTGFGKSIPYQIFSLVLEGLGRDGKVLVCCPLLSLMSDQVARANAIRGVTAAFIGNEMAITDQCMCRNSGSKINNWQSLVGGGGGWEWDCQLLILDPQ